MVGKENTMAHKDFADVKLCTSQMLKEV